MARIDLQYYENREHAKAKHWLLEKYIQRYTMILGRRVNELVFVDAFAGPWQSGANDRSDTSFGLSFNALNNCANTLEKTFKRKPTIRALWIEENDEAFCHLSEFARNNSSSRIRIETRHASFQNCVDKIVDFIGPTAHGFVFVDPKGYSGLIEPGVLAPLLNLPRAELLINYMWQFIRYAFAQSEIDGHRKNLERIYGCARLNKLLQISDPADLEIEACRCYEESLKAAAAQGDSDRLWVLSHPIADTHGSRHPKYYLVHATHAAKGITTFAEQCDDANKAQESIFFTAQINRREQKTGVSDLFPEVETAVAAAMEPETNAWMQLLPDAGAAELIDSTKWAWLLERGRCLPGNLQAGLKKLIDQGVLENCDANGGRRYKRFVHYEKSERIRRLK